MDNRKIQNQDQKKKNKFLQILLLHSIKSKVKASISILFYKVTLMKCKVKR